MQPFPLHPPGAWFEKPAWLEPGQKLTVMTDGTEAGRVAGYVAPFEQCILDGKPGCWTVPSSPSAYAAAMQGETLTAEGAVVKTANIGGGVNHARVSENFRGAVAHYDNTASQLMRVAYGEDDYGVWCAGAIWPDVTDHDLAIIRASALSGDWRYRPELAAFDMAGAQLVNNPGFPLIRQIARAASAVDYDRDFDWSGPLPVFVGGLGGAAAIDDEPCPSCGHVPDALEERVADLETVVASLRQS